MTTLANKYRPKKFSEVVGQGDQTDVLIEIVQKGWIPPAIMLTGPFGTGKTTMARLVSRSLLCENRQGHEPCGACDSCLSMDRDNHPAYTELDAASQGLIEQVRQMKDQLSYRVTGHNLRIVCYDESHMLSTQAQNALLQTLEEGQEGVVFIFATTEASKMLATIRSRCVELKLKLLTAGQITDRLKQVAAAEGIALEEKAARVIGTYVRGHVRDAMILLEQIARTSAGGEVTEAQTRLYLRMNQYDDVYKLLTMTDRKEGVTFLEDLLCNYAPSELAEATSRVLVDAYKLKIGIDGFTQVDEGWLKKVLEVRGGALLNTAQAILELHTDFASIHYGVAAFANILFEGAVEPKMNSSSLVPAPTAASVPSTAPPRKPGK